MVELKKYTEGKIIMGKYKKFNAMLLILIMCAMAISLTSCADKESVKKENVSVTTAATNEQLEKIIELTGIKSEASDAQNYWGTIVQSITKGNGGYYYFTAQSPLYLMFFDETSKESIPVCGKADCSHDCADCNAYFGSAKHYDRNAPEKVTYTGASLYFYNGYLYTLNSDGNLVRIAADGSERQTLMKVDSNYDGSSNTKLVFYDNMFCVYNSSGGMGMNKEQTETIRRYSLDGKTEETIIEYTGTNVSINSVKNYGSQLFFLISSLSMEREDGNRKYNYSYNGLYTYNCKTGEAGKVIDNKITDYAVDEQNGRIYYYTLGEGLFEYNISSKEVKKLYTADADSGICDISYDGKYIYLYNGRWSSYTKTSESEVEVKCRVIEKNGNELCQISFNNPIFCYFGDSSYMFALQGDEEGKTALTYLDKKRLGSDASWEILQ